MAIGLLEMEIEGFFICHVIWCVYGINGLRNFVDNIFSSKATFLSSLVAIGLVEVEI